MSKKNTVASAYTTYRHLQQYCSLPSVCCRRVTLGKKCRRWQQIAISIVSDQSLSYLVFSSLSIYLSLYISFYLFTYLFIYQCTSGLFRILHRRSHTHTHAQNKTKKYLSRVTQRKFEIDYFSKV